jgi:hypothetical protein
MDIIVKVCCIFNIGYSPHSRLSSTIILYFFVTTLTVISYAFLNWRWYSTNITEILQSFLNSPICSPKNALHSAFLVLGKIIMNEGVVVAQEDE